MAATDNYFEGLSVPEGSIVEKKHDLYNRGCRWRVVYRKKGQRGARDYRLESIGSTAVLYVSEGWLLSDFRLVSEVDARKRDTSQPVFSIPPPFALPGKD